VYPDPKHWWMLPKNHLNFFSAKGFENKKIVANNKFFAKTKTFNFICLFFIFV
jgi:hypothetical protein